MSIVACEQLVKKLGNSLGCTVRESDDQLGLF